MIFLLFFILRGRFSSFFKKNNNYVSIAIYSPKGQHLSFMILLTYFSLTTIYLRVVVVVVIVAKILFLDMANIE